MECIYLWNIEIYKIQISWQEINRSSQLFLEDSESFRCKSFDIKKNDDINDKV